MSDTLARLNDLFIDVFDDDDIEITLETSAADIDAWDSMMHVTLMLRVEAAFGLRFDSGEVVALKNVGELVRLIDERGS